MRETKRQDVRYTERCNDLIRNDLIGVYPWRLCGCMCVRLTG